METITEHVLPQYKIVKLSDKFYIQVLNYNPMKWHPWQYNFITGNGYSNDQIKYAMSFDNEQDAEDYLNTILPK